MQKVSVIIPTYNRAEKLHKSMESVLAQTYGDFELLIIDDGSTDSTAEVVSSFGDDRIRYVKMAQNVGASAARNEGVRLAEGDWIAFHDSDDFWRPDKLQKQMDYMERNPEYDVIYCSYLMHTDEEEIVVPNENWSGELEGDLFISLLARNSIGAPTMLIKKSVFEETGGFDTSFKSLEDWDLALRIAMRHQIGYVPEVLVDAYMSSGGVSSNVGAYYESRCKLIGRYRQILTELGIFDRIVTDVFGRAQAIGVLEDVKKMLMYYLSI